MSKLRALILYLILVFAGAGMIAPWLWSAADALRDALGAGSVAWLVDHPFSRYVHRCLLVLALAGLYPLSGALQCRSWAALGLARGGQQGRRIGAGFLLGLVAFACVLAAEVSGATRSWKSEWAAGVVVRGVLSAFASGAVVAFMEELLFRGMLLRGLTAELGAPAALGVSSALYALVHFFHRPPTPEVVTWHSGYDVLAAMMRGFAEFEGWVPAYVTLFLLGVLLGVSCLREGNLYFAMGLHGGLVFWIKLRGLLTSTGPAAPQGHTILSGWLAFWVVAVGLGVYLWWWRRVGARVSLGE